MQNKTEQRKAERVEIPLKIHCLMKKKGALQKKGVICNDISGLGVQLTLDEPVRIDNKIPILLNMASGTKPIETICRVMWCKQLGEGKFRAGLKFIKIKENIRFVELLCEKMLVFSLSRKQ